MRIIKIQHKDILDAFKCEYDLYRAGVKVKRLEQAVIAISNMHNTNTIQNIIVDNKGYEVSPTQYDIDAINS